MLFKGFKKKSESELLQISTHRVEALGDALFAIVMTLMILELKAPDMDDFATSTALIAKLKLLKPNLISFLISFVVLGIFWFAHSVQFYYIKRVNRNLLWLNIFFYLCICLIPFSAALLGRFHTHQFAIVIYGINLSCSVFLLYLHWRYGIRNKLLCPEEVPKELKREANFQMLFAPLLYAIAIVFSFWDTNISMWIYVVTPVFYFLPNRIDSFLP